MRTERDLPSATCTSLSDQLQWNFQISHCFCNKWVRQILLKTLQENSLQKARGNLNILSAYSAVMFEITSPVECLVLSLLVIERWERANDSFLHPWLGPAWCIFSSDRASCTFCSIPAGVALWARSTWPEAEGFCTYRFTGWSNLKEERQHCRCSTFCPLQIPGGNNNKNIAEAEKPLRIQALS